MARIRTYKPEIWSSETFTSLSFGARLLALGLWSHVDDRGVIPMKLRQWKALVFPSDEVSCEEVEVWRDELLAADGFAESYEVGGQAYLRFPKFRDHQRIQTPTVRWPIPGETSEDLHNFTKSSKPSQKKALEGKGKDRKGKEGIPPKGGVGEKRERSSSADADFQGAVLPDSLEPHREALIQWQAYKRSEIKTEAGWRALFTRIERYLALPNPRPVRELVERSMSEGWKGLIFDQDERSASRPAPKPQAGPTQGYVDPDEALV